ncbi:hypothetical protein LCGC14_0891500 [marine sediment metagenome]|uniref:Uncharacterized protein n=1 Tax=marine sediment metagenome TaxID=412755 RepID=A0A0F9NZ65_9ZZZZ
MTFRISTRTGTIDHDTVDISIDGSTIVSLMENVVDDTAPRLGGQLDVDGKGLGDGTNLLLDFVEDASAVNHIEIENEATGSGPIIRAAGADTNIDLNIEPSGSGTVQIGIPESVGTTPVISPTGADTNINLKLSSKGTGNVVITPKLEVSAGTGDLLSGDFHASATSSIRTRSETGKTLQLLAGVVGTVISASSGSYIAFHTNSDNNLSSPSNERMKIESGGNIGIGITNPDGTLHVHQGSAGTVTALNAANTLIVESSDSGGMSILGPDASSQQIFFGSPTDAQGALIRWNFSGGNFQIGSAIAGSETVLTSGNFVEAARFDSAGNFVMATANTITLGGELIGVGNVVSDVELKDISETVATDATFTGVETLDYTEGAYRKLTLTGNVTSLTIDNWPASIKVGSLTLRIKQDATGGRTITWPAATDWAGGTAPTLSTAANAVDFVMLWTDDAGITVYGAEVGLDFK